MSWLYDHTEGITIFTLVALPTLLLGTMMLLASGKTKEVSELEGFPEGNKND